MEIVPITRDAARAFVTKYHRHNEAPPPMSVMFVAALQDDGEIVAVVIAGRPVARALCDGVTLEVSRVCVKPGIDVTKNANSRLYGAIRRAAAALGYKRLVTYTLVDEPGASLRASGFEPPVEIGARSWRDSNDPDLRPRFDTTLWGERVNSAGVAKYRWEMAL